MPGPKLALEGYTIVLAGILQPLEFQPSALAREDVLSSEDALNAKIGFLFPEHCLFTTDRLQVSVTPQRLDASTPDPSQVGPLRDVVMGAWSVLASKITVLKVGLNCQMHFALDSVDQWHAVGHALAPKSVWLPVMGEPGTQSLTILGKRPESTAEHLLITVQPSKKVPNGVFVSTNEQHGAIPLNTGKVKPEILASTWESAIAYARKVADHILQSTIESIHCHV